MTSHDVLFHAFAAVAIGAALLSALRADLGRATTAALAGGAAVVGLLGLAAAPFPATLVGACVFAGYAARQRVPADSGRASDDASTFSSRLRAAALVVSFFVIAARAVLIVRWSFADAAPRTAAFAGLTPVSLAHYLVVALAILSIGLFACLTRRTVAGVGLGLAHCSAGAVLALASVSRFVGDAGEAGQLAAVACVVTIAAGVTTMRVAASGRDFVERSEVAWRVAGSLSMVLAGVTLALLATAW